MIIKIKENKVFIVKNLILEKIKDKQKINIKIYKLIK